MALVDNAWYVDFGNGSSTGYYAATAWAALTTKVAGNLIRQLAAPATGSERIFVCTKSTAGTGVTSAAEPTWTVTRGAITADTATLNWQECTGIAALNGDLTNTPNWTTVKNTVVTLGQVIKNNAGTLILIATVGGTAGNGAEPSWAAYTTTGATTTDNTVTWVTLRPADYTNWNAPHARLANSFATNWGQAGNQFFVASEHAETQATAISLIAPGTLASPNTITCVDKINVPPGSANVTTGATISTTGANNITAQGVGAYWNGLTLQAGSAASTANLILCNSNNSFHSYKTCSFTLNNTSASSQFQLSNGSNIKFICDTCTFTFGSNTSQSFSSTATGTGVIRGGSVVVGANIPTTLFGSGPSVLSLEGVDLSAFGSGKNIFPQGGTPQLRFIKDCKLGASVALSATPTMPTPSTFLIRSDSAAANYRHENNQYAGTQTIETTIVRTGGATAGTPISWKIVTTANSKWVLPFEGFLGSIWNATVGSPITITAFGIWGTGAVPNNDDIWIDVEYLGSSATPVGSFATATKANNLATGSALSSDTSTWGGSTTPFKITVTVTPQMAGPISIYVKAAKASTTFYIDPTWNIGTTIGNSFILAPGVFTNEPVSGSGVSRSRIQTGM